MILNDENDMEMIYHDIDLKSKR